MDEKQKPFIVKSEKAFGALPHWLKKLGADTYSYSTLRKINVGSGDGRRYAYLGSIIVCDPALFEPTCRAIEKAYGWKPRDQAVAS